jgi:hypothetical protein
VTEEQALEYVDELAVLKRFPTQPNARLVLAKRLVDWCRGTPKVFPSEQAKWLVKAVAELDEYPGPHSLHKMIEDKFYPAGATAVYKSPNYGPPVVDCKACNDWWTFKDPATGKFVWCDCRNAREMREENPTWLEAVNRFPGVDKPTPLHLLSEAAFKKRIR